MSVLISNFQTMPDSAYRHLEFSSETSVVIKMPSDRIGNTNARCLTPRPKHRLQYSIEIIAHNLYAIHKPELEGCVAGQQTSDDRRLLVEGHERKQNRSAHCSKSAAASLGWARLFLGSMPLGRGGGRPCIISAERC